MNYVRKAKLLEHVISGNSVCLTGKISRAGGLKYLPSGTPIFELTLAVPQHHFDKASVGYFEVVISGRAAEDINGQYTIGKTITVNGNLWARTYRNRKGAKVTETKVIVENIEGESK